MKVIENKIFDEERALYGSAELAVKNCTFAGPADGESAFKECSRVEVESSFFNLRYPFWHDTGLKIENSEMSELCRAALWYSRHVEIRDTKMHGIKALRECSDVMIENCDIISPEFGWSVDGMRMANSTVQSEYFMMRSADLQFTDVKLIGKYSFQYIKDAVFENCVLDTKDAFWHSENVTVKNSVVKGEYLAWYSDSLTLINCKIIGTQPFCYCKNLTLIDCEMLNTDLCFERSEVQAVITSSIDSIKNPYWGRIQAPEAGEIIRDDTAAKGEIVIGEVNFGTEEYRSIILKNQEFVREYVKKEIPQMQVEAFHNTYFLKLIFADMIGSGKEAAEFIKRTGFYVSYGKEGGKKKEGRKKKENSNGSRWGEKEFLRIDTACSPSDLERQLRSLKDGICEYEKFCTERC